MSDTQQEVREQVTHADINFPDLESNRPSLNADCGENPVSLPDEKAKDPAMSFVWDFAVMPAATDTFLANVVHLVWSSVSRELYADER
jgi:hypothetical protein